MIGGLRVVLRGLNSVRINGYAHIWANIAFVAFSLPIITLPAALSALFRIGHDAQTEPSEADLALFWDTFKANFWQATQWGIANTLFAIITFSNLIAYRYEDALEYYVLRLIWIASAFLWLGVFLYTWPIFYEMEEPDVWIATRNALVMTLRHPLFTLIVLLCIGILAAISTVLAAMWMLLTWGAISAIANAAVLDRLTNYRAAQEA